MHLYFELPSLFIFTEKLVIEIVMRERERDKEKAK